MGQSWSYKCVINNLSCVAPELQIKFTNWLVAKSFDGERGELTYKLRDKVESSLRSLFEEYSSGGDKFEVSSQKA